MHKFKIRQIDFENKENSIKKTSATVVEYSRPNNGGVVLLHKRGTKHVTNCTRTSQAKDLLAKSQTKPRREKAESKQVIR